MRKTLPIADLIATAAISYKLKRPDFESELEIGNWQSAMDSLISRH